MTPEPTDQQIAEARSVIAAFEAVMPVVLALMDRAAKAWSALEIVRISDDPRVPFTDEMGDLYDDLTGHRQLYNLVADIHDATNERALRTPECKAATGALHERWRQEVN